MARVKIHTPCMRPLAECDCPPDDDDEPGQPEDGGGDDAA